MSATAPAVWAPHAPSGKSTQLHLADELKRQIDGIRNRHFFPLGYMLRMQLGACDESAYAENEAIRNRVAGISRMQGLALDWKQGTHPQIAELRDGQVGRTEIFVFPRGIMRPPDIADPRFRRLSITDPMPPEIPQDIDWYASGRIYSREFGDWFRVLQPVEQIAVRVTSTLVILRGRTHPGNGTKVAFMYSQKKQMGFLVGGVLEF